jgi:hypothetical protein
MSDRATTFLFVGDTLTGVLPETYLQMPTVQLVGPGEGRGERTCTRCSKSWRPHAWVFYGRMNLYVAPEVFDCSELPRGGAQ